MNKETDYQGGPVAWVRFRNGEPDYDGDAVMIMNVPGDTLGDGDSWEPVYTHADSATVERMREDVKSLKIQLAASAGTRMGLEEANADWRESVNGLRARMTEVYALLRDLDDAWNSHDGKKRFGKLMQKVEALCASAEPLD